MIFPSRTELTVMDNVLSGQSDPCPCRILTLEKPDWAEWHPGQFVMLRPSDWGQDLTWARPFSICRVTADSLVIFFQVAGRGTERMAGLKKGDKVVSWGPLGTSFAVEENTETLLLSGGIGIAPFVGYVDKHPSPDHVSIVFGHRLPSDIYPVDTLSKKIHVEEFIEHGSEDIPCFQALMSRHMDQCREKNGLVLACGPTPFLHFIWKYSQKICLRAQLSLENRMACGVGACLGCVTVTSKKWPDKEKAGMPVQTCTHGPVFWAEHLDLDADISKLGK